MELNNFDSIRISLASSEQVLDWSHGEVTKPETINYRTLKPEKDGLFCEAIFGPTKDWECHCGKYKRVRYKGMICDKCGVEITRAKVRRERMGHIQLAAPVSHIWYFKGIPSRMGLLLDMSPRSLERVLYFASYIVTDPGTSNFTYKQVISDREYHEAMIEFGRDSFKAGMGAENIKEVLKNIDLDETAEELREELNSTSGQRRVRATRRLEVIEAFRQSGNRPEWIILDVLPVIPPELRPMVQLDGGRFATSDLNDLYRRVINRNNRLKRLLELKAPDIIVRNEKRMLQEAVDALIDNGRRGRAVTGPGNRPLKSLSDLLRGKQGRFRQNLLGKRVDYSGRSVIVVGPELKMYQCGLPKEMAIELFKPFVLKKLVEEDFAHNVRQAKKMVERMDQRVWDVLEEIIKDHPVLLNRAPTLHRLGIQAFEPVLVEGRALSIHPLVCTAYNADFDGDQMAVHIPLSVEAQAEARFLMLSVNNMLKPQDGKPVVSPTQDMVMGIYYLTLLRDGEKGENAAFISAEEAIMAYQTHNISLHAKIKVRRHGEFEGEKVTKLIETTPGLLMLNEALPQDLGYIDRTNIDTFLDPEINKTITKNDLNDIVDRCYHTHGSAKTAVVLDDIKRLGFEYSTTGAITISVSDLTVPEEKKEILEQAEKRVLGIESEFERGMLSESERKQSVIEIWDEATHKVSDALMDTLDKDNPVYMMANSGARGSVSQIRQLAGMRGLMADPSGAILELPVKANFREGLNVLEFFISTHGARKGLADTALRTADSGYLTRRLVDVAQEVIVREDDCFKSLGEGVKGIVVSDMKNGKELVESLADRILGRTSVDEIVHPKTGDVIVEANTMINSNNVRDIIEAGIEEVSVRSVLTCRARLGVCSACYGSNLATSEPVSIGEAVGTIAAQSIGEPGTQLTMRTFHTGGVAGDDITQGLPRVEELFEARKPKGLAIITEISGIVQMGDNKNRHEVTISNDEEETETYLIPFGSRLRVADGDAVEAGQELTDGPVNPHDILKIKGIKGVQDYLLREVQMVYRMQGVEINDKHIEVIIRQMLSKVQIEKAGDTAVLPGELVDVFRFEEENERMILEGGQTASAKYVLLGITKASLATESFLSAASFQETTRVLTDAAIKGKVDPLLGLKENVIIGKLIPAGTGLSRYNDIEIYKSNLGMRAALEQTLGAEIEEPTTDLSLFDEDLELPVDLVEMVEGTNIITTEE